jgi:hypothetical protein
MRITEQNVSTVYAVTADDGAWLGCIIVDQRPGQPRQLPRWVAGIAGRSVHGESDSVEEAGAAIVAALADADDAEHDAGHMPHIPTRAA